MGIFPADRPKPKSLLDAIINVGSGLARDIPRAANWWVDSMKAGPEAAQQQVLDTIGGAAESLATLPKRATGASETMRTEGTYNPEPIVEAATLPWGTGAIAGVPLKVGEVAFGAGILRPKKGTGGYHATVAKDKYSKFKESDVDLGTHLADDPDVAIQYALGTHANDFEGLVEGARTMPVVADLRKPLRYPTDPVNWRNAEEVIYGLREHRDHTLRPPKGLLEDMIRAEKDAGGWEKNFIPMLEDKGYDSIYYPHQTGSRGDMDYNSYMAFRPSQVMPRYSPEGQAFIKEHGIIEPSKKLYNLDDVLDWLDTPEAQQKWLPAPEGPKPSSMPIKVKNPGNTLTWNPQVPMEQSAVEGLLKKLKSGEINKQEYLAEHGKVFGLFDKNPTDWATYGKEELIDAMKKKK